MNKLTDNDPMPFGKHKGKKMANVPAEYFVWLIENNLKPGDVKDYIEENWDGIMQEFKMNS